MNKVIIEWGSIEKTKAVEDYVFSKARKVLERAHDATKFVINLSHEKIGNGDDIYKSVFELRLPQHQDIVSEQSGEILYDQINNATDTLLRQLKDRKDQIISKRHQRAI